MARKPTIPDDYYDLLQVNRRASKEVIESAYRALMQLHHPDHNGSTEMATALNLAHATLIDVVKRRDYDKRQRTADPKVIGDYRIIAKIAEGGFGKTYKAEHVLVHEPVCIKHCSEISAAHDTVLIEEAKAMWDLRHYSIPAVRNLVRLEDGSLALVMSFIEGPTLEQVVQRRKRPVDPENVAWITQRVLHALMYIHSQGVIHGDLKPQNIIIQPDSHNAVLVDFGLSMIKPRAADKAKGYTDYYAPPEQEAGQVLIPESDLYSLGMTMIFALTGDVKRLPGKEVPLSVPGPMCDFIRNLIHQEPLDRPRVWQKDNLLETVEVMRQAAFGRMHSQFKALDV